VKAVAASIEPFRIGLRRPLITSRGALRHREGFILRLRSASGQCGAGEASPAYWLGDEDLRHTRISLETIVSAASGSSGLEALRTLLRDGSASLTPAAACALDTALLDLEARRRGVPVASLLGAVQISSTQLCALLGGETSHETADAAALAVARGYRCLKIKVGAPTIEDDERRVGAVRNRVGNDAAIRLDANRAWSFGDAQRALCRLARFEIEFIEEPLAEPSPAAIASLGNQSRVPIALDESIRCEQDLADFIVTGAADVIVLKAARIGGPTRAARIGQAASQAGMKVVVTDSIESDVGMAAAVHLAAAIATPGLAIGLGGASMLDRCRLGGGERPVRPLRPAIGLDVATGSEDDAHA